MSSRKPARPSVLKISGPNKVIQDRWKVGKEMKHAREDYNRIQDPANKIPEDEPVFLLRAQDKTAAESVRYWVHLQEGLPDHDKEAVRLAKKHIELMDSWHVKKTADVPPEPSSVKVPNCLRDDHFIAIDEGGCVYIFDSEPERTEAYWRCPDGISAIEIYESDSLILPKVHWTEACWQVFELRVMQKEYEEWEAQQAEESSTEDDGEYIVWEPGTLPEQFRNMEKPVSFLHVRVNDVDWRCGSSGDGWKVHYHRMRKSDWNRLKKESEDNINIDEMVRDHGAMCEYRENRGMSLKKHYGKDGRISYLVYVNCEYKAEADDPADAILAVKGGE